VSHCKKNTHTHISAEKEREEEDEERERESSKALHNGKLVGGLILCNPYTRTRRESKRERESLVRVLAAFTVRPLCACFIGVSCLARCFVGFAA